MPRDLNRKIYRILDADYNRLKEGLRVCEEVCRFILDDRSLSAAFKDVRHRTGRIFNFLPLKFRNISESRNSDSDVGRRLTGLELKRRNIADVFYANIQRTKESLRVLEEFIKVVKPKIALRFKELRYEVYSLEKDVLKKLSSLSCSR